MKNILLVFTIAFFSTAMAQNRSITDVPPGTEGWKFDSLVYSQNIEINKDIVENGVQIDVRFVFPVQVSAGIDLKEIQSLFGRFLLMDFAFTGTPQEAFDKIVERFIVQAKEYTDYFKEEENTGHYWGYEEIWGCDVSFDQGYAMSVCSGGYSYTGGAHGMYGSSYFNIDKRDGTLITEELLFRSGYGNNLAALIQNEIVQRNQSEDETDHIGLFDEVEEVRPNKNFYFSEYGIVYCYNIYEIAPYVQGMIEIEIPYEQILPLVNEKYLPVIKSIINKTI